MEIVHELFTTQGRINRLRYLKCMILLAVCGTISKIFTTATATLLTGDPNGALSTMLLLGLALIAGAANVMLIIRRLHDLDKSGYFIILTFIPVVNIIFSIYLFCAAGTVGWNQYGADRLQESD